MSLGHSAPCVVVRVVFVFRAIVGDALDHYLGIVAAGEGALRVGPIVLGLAFVVAGHSAFMLSVVAKVSGRFRRVFINHEITESVDGVAFLRVSCIGGGPATENERGPCRGGAGFDGVE